VAEHLPTDLDLAAIRARDAESAATWYTGPTSPAAVARRDRRALLAEVDRLDKKCGALAFLLYGLPTNPEHERIVDEVMRRRLEGTETAPLDVPARISFPPEMSMAESHGDPRIDGEPEQPTR
jgi:hypothetical protein